MPYNDSFCKNKTQCTQWVGCFSLVWMIEYQVVISEKYKFHALAMKMSSRIEILKSRQKLFSYKDYFQKDAWKAIQER